MIMLRNEYQKMEKKINSLAFRFSEDLTFKTIFNGKSLSDYCQDAKILSLSFI